MIVKRENESHFLYPMLASAPVIVFAALIVFVFRIYFNLSFSPAWVYILLLLPAVIETAVWNAMKHKSTFVHRLGEFLIIPFLFYALYSLIKSGPFIQRFIPTFDSIFFGIAALFIWFFTFICHRKFTYNEEFADPGNRKSNELTALVNINLFRYSRFVKVLMIISWVFMFLPWIFSPEVSGFLVLYSVFMFAVFVFCLMRVSMMSLRYQFHDAGLHYSEQHASKNKNAGIVIILLSVSGAFALARGKVIFSIANIFASILSLFSGSNKQVNIGELDMMSTGLARQLNAILSEHTKTMKRTPVVKELIVFAVAILTLILLSVLIRMFINYIKYRRKQEQTGSFLSVLWKGFLHFLAGVFTVFIEIFSILFFFRFFKRRLARKKSSVPDTYQLKVSARKIKSVKKEQEINDVVSFFLKLIRWGVKQNVPWLSSMPMEYTGRLAEQFPEIESDLNEIVLVYEESLFSENLVKTEVISSYKEQIKTVISRKQKRT